MWIALFPNVDNIVAVLGIDIRKVSDVVMVVVVVVVIDYYYGL